MVFAIKCFAVFLPMNISYIDTDECLAQRIITPINQTAEISCTVRGISAVFYHLYNQYLFWANEKRMHRLIRGEDIRYGHVLFFANRSAIM